MKSNKYIIIISEDKLKELRVGTEGNGDGHGGGASEGVVERHSRLLCEDAQTTKVWISGQA